MNWIDDDLPPEGEEVIVGDYLSQFTALGIYSHLDDTFYCSSIHPLPIDFVPTHWMPKPKITEDLFCYDNS